MAKKIQYLPIEKGSSVQRLDYGQDDSVVTSWRFRIYPNKAQVKALEHQLWLTQQVYNSLIELTRMERTYRHKVFWQNTGFDYFGVDTSIRQIMNEWFHDGEYPVGLYSDTINATSIDRFTNAYKEFRKGKRGFPRFCPIRDWNSLHYKKAGRKPLDPKGGGYELVGWFDESVPLRLRIRGVRDIRIKLSREFPQGTVFKTLCIKREGHRWFASFCIELNRDILPILPKNGKSVGVDLGVTRTVALSDGSFIDSRRVDRENHAKVQRLQRSLAKKQRFSNNWRKAAARLAQAKAYEARVRDDQHKKVAHRLTTEYDTIIREDLGISKMVRSAKGAKESPGKNVKAKSGLNRSILDAGWNILNTHLDHKVVQRGRAVVKIDPRYTSQTCSMCGNVDASARNGIHYSCSNCGYETHADTNAAVNIREKGLTSLAGS